MMDDEEPSKYKAINNNSSDKMDDTYGDSDDEDALASIESQGLVTHKKKKVRINPNSGMTGKNGNHRDHEGASNSTCMLLITWSLIIGAMGLGVVGLMAWRKAQHDGHSMPSLDEGEFYNPESGAINAHEQVGTKKSGPSTSAAGKNRDPIPLDIDAMDTAPEPHHDQYVHYDPDAVLHHSNPLDLPYGTADDNIYGAPFTPPRLFDDQQLYDAADEDLLGYFQKPTIVNNTLIFCNQGDLFVTKLEHDSSDESSSLPARLSAFQLTTTVGNVLDPKLHPSGQLVQDSPISQATALSDTRSSRQVIPSLSRPHFSLCTPKVD
jgi:hypothetical protein